MVWALGKKKCPCVRCEHSDTQLCEAKSLIFGENCFRFALGRPQSTP